MTFSTLVNGCAPEFREPIHVATAEPESRALGRVSRYNQA
jgi:hypothetical protein